jgi:hypothetical protein
MGYAVSGTIVYQGRVHTIEYSVDPGRADESWAMTKARYFPGYDGPPPSGLSKKTAHPFRLSPKKRA